MATETFKKRQKEMARREKQKLKVARKLERKAEKARGENQTDESGPESTPLDYRDDSSIS